MIDWPAVTQASRTFDLPAYLHSRGMTFSESGGQLVLDCPRCGGRRKLYIDSDSKKFICFRCTPEFQGSLLRLVAAFHNTTFGEAWRFVQTSFQRARLPQAVVDVRPSPAVGFPDGYQPFSLNPSRVEIPYVRYLEGRGVPLSVAMEYHVGYAWLGPLAGRVIVPVVEDGVVVHWVARDILSRSVPKTLTPRGNKQSHYLFNLTRVRDYPTVVVVEGVFDAFRHLSSCVASFGKRLSETQVERLLGAGVRRLVLAYDGDAYGAALQQGLRLQGVFREVRVARLPVDRDPAELNEEAFSDCLRAARVPSRADLFAARCTLQSR